MDLVQEIHEMRKLEKSVTTILENSRVHDSQSNGTAERAVQTVEGIVRTIKLALERRIGKKIPSTHPLMTWLVEHAVDVDNKYSVGTDGRTAYEKSHCELYHGEMFEFGRRVFHMSPGRPQEGSMVEMSQE